MLETFKYPRSMEEAVFLISRFDRSFDGDCSELFNTPVVSFILERQDPAPEEDIPCKMVTLYAPTQEDLDNGRIRIKTIRFTVLEESEPDRIGEVSDVAVNIDRLRDMLRAVRIAFPKPFSKNRDDE